MDYENSATVNKETIITNVIDYKVENYQNPLDEKLLEANDLHDKLEGINIKNTNQKDETTMEEDISDKIIENGKKLEGLGTEIKNNDLAEICHKNNSDSKYISKHIESIEDEIARLVGEEVSHENYTFSKSETSTDSMNKQKYDDENEVKSNIDESFNDENEEVMNRVCVQNENLTLKQIYKDLSDTNVLMENTNQRLIPRDNTEVKCGDLVSQEEIQTYEISEEESFTQGVIKNTVEDSNCNQSDTLNKSDDFSFEENCSRSVYEEITSENVEAKVERCKNREDSLEQNEFSVEIQNEIETIDYEDNHQYNIRHLCDVKEVKELHRCNMCQYTTPCVGTLRRHILTNHDSKSGKCKYCYKKFNSRALVQKHIKDEHSKKLRKCPYCSYKMICNGNAMQKHIMNLHLPEEVESVDKSPRHEGLKQNGARGAYKCGECSYSNKCLEIMQSHIEMHNFMYVLRCTYCHYMTNNRKLYKLHRIDTHKLAKKIYICTKCFFQTENQEEHSCHIFKPHDSHKCSKCNFETFNIEIFYSHIDQHNSNKMGIACDNCGYMGSSQENLRNHMLAQHSELSVQGDGDDGISLKNFNETMDVECSDRNIKPVKGNSIEFEKINKRNLGKRFSVQNSQQILETQDPQTIEGLSFKCRQCAFTTSTYKAMIIHKGQTHDKSHFKCPSCNFETNLASTLCIHFDNYPRHIRKMLTCPFCDIKMDDQLHMQNHLSLEHCHIQTGLRTTKLVEGDETEYESIEDSAQSPDDLENAAYTINVDTSETSYHCRLCTFNTSDMFLLKFHHKEGLCAHYLKCPRCPQHQSSNLIKFWEHLDQHCPRCRFQSNNPNKLKSHILTHVPKYKSCSSPRMLKSSKDSLSENPFNKYHRNYSNGISNEMNEDEMETNRLFKLENNNSEECGMEAEENQDEDQRLIKSSFNHKEVENSHSVNSSTEEIRIVFDDSYSENEDISYGQEMETCINRNQNEKSVNSTFTEYIQMMVDNQPYEGNYDSQLTNYVNPIKRALKSDDSENENTDFEKPEELRLLIEEPTNNVKVNFRSSRGKHCGIVHYKPIRIIQILEFQCFDCLNVYKTRYILIDHRKKLHGLKKPHSCTYCTEIFETYNFLKSHYYRVHQVSYHNKGPIFKCPLCDFTCISLKQMQKHVRKDHQRNAVGFRKRVKLD